MPMSGVSRVVLGVTDIGARSLPARSTTMLVFLSTCVFVSARSGRAYGAPGIYTLFLQMAEAGAVDHPALAPIGFGISTSEEDNHGRTKSGE